MDSQNLKGNLINMPNAARKIEVDDFNAQAMLEEAYAEIRALRAQKSPTFQLKRLTEETSNADHLREIFINGHQEEVSRKTTEK